MSKREQNSAEESRIEGAAEQPVSPRKRGRRRKGLCLEDRPMLEANAAGIDIGAREIFVAVPPDRDENPVRVFATFTEDLEALARWLKACLITTAAMESTGVYWIPLYDVLEQRGIKPCLADARNMKNVPGRRTHWHECQWLQYLHAVGLLRAAFRPEAEVCAIRALMRRRNDLAGLAHQHIQHMHKTLTQMNVQLHHVISDITGLTGLAIADAILSGQQDPRELAKLRDPRIRASPETIRKSLAGNWRPEHLFTLRQSRQTDRHYQEQIAACDEEIEKRLAHFASRVDPETQPLPPDGKKHRKKRSPRQPAGGTEPQRVFDARLEAYKLFGVDVTQIPGLLTMAFRLFSEVGRDMAKWPTAKHFASWLALCPDNDISGGRVLWRGQRKVKNPAAQLFRLAAYALHRSATPLGSYLRRMKSKLGSAAATTATAHKIAIIFYTMVKNQVEYDETLWAQRDAKRDQRMEAKLKRQAQARGFKLVPLEDKTAP